MKAFLLLEFWNFFQLKIFVVLFKDLVNGPLIVLENPHKMIVGFNLKEIELTVQLQEHARCPAFALLALTICNWLAACLLNL